MERLYRLEVDAEQMCRACLKKSSPLENLFCGEIVDGEIVPMPEVYENVTGLQVRSDDGFPQKLCENCKLKIIDAFIIRGKCIKSAGLLTKLLNISDASKHKKTEELTEQEVDETLLDADLTEEIEYIGELDDERPEEVLEYSYDEDSQDELVDIESTEMEILCEDTNIKLESIEEFTDNDTEATEATPRVTRRSGDRDTCKVCSQPMSMADMCTHMKEHDEFLTKVTQHVEFFRCENCRAIFPTAASFAEHLSDPDLCVPIMQQHNDLHCTDYQFLDDPIESALANVTIISGSACDYENFTCFCGVKARDVPELVMHFRAKHSSDDESLLQPYKDTCRMSHSCGVCPVATTSTFENMKDAIFHVFCHRNEFGCPQLCGKYFKTLKVLKRHVEHDHSARGPQVSCQHCRKRFGNFQLLKQHVKSECTQRKLVCSMCPDKRYFHKQALVIHMRKHSNDQKFQCKLCSKGFSQSNDLKNHLRTHTGERPYQCSLCDKSFKTISCRLDHLKTHDTETMVKCTLCEKTFKSERILRGHMRIHKEKAFECDLCPKKFYRMYHLKSHMKTHPEHEAEYI